MPQVSAAVLRSTPSSTGASASIRRAAALFFSPLAALRSSEAVRSSRVTDTATPIDAAPLKSQHRVRVSLIWESPMSHSFGPLVSDLILRSIVKLCVSKDEAIEAETALAACDVWKAQFANQPFGLPVPCDRSAQGPDQAVDRTDPESSPAGLGDGRTIGFGPAQQQIVCRIGLPADFDLARGL